MFQVKKRTYILTSLFTLATLKLSAKKTTLDLMISTSNRIAKSWLAKSNDEMTKLSQSFHSGFRGDNVPSNLFYPNVFVKIKALIDDIPIQVKTMSNIPFLYLLRRKRPRIQGVLIYFCDLSSYRNMVKSYHENL